MLAMFFTLSISAQEFLEVSGKVNALETQEPLEGCHVYIHENLGTITDDKGYFKFKVPSALVNDKLHVSYLGFKDFITAVSDIDVSFLEIKLEEDVIMLDEVIVYADPWDDFRESIETLTGIYSDKRELYIAILAELDKIDPQITKVKKIEVDGTMNNE